MRSCVEFLAVTLLLLHYTCEGSNSADVVSNLFLNYDKGVRPGFGGPPLLVTGSVYISSFGNIEETSMEYKSYGYYRQYWTDLRLAGRSNITVTLKGEEIANVWKPDPYCINARESNLGTPDEEINSLLHISPDGSIFYSRLLVLNAECFMDLRDFPMDTQNCMLKFGSYSHSTRDIRYQWYPPGVIVGSSDMAQFKLTSTIISNATDVYSSGGYDTITATFKFERRLGYFLIQVYAPDIFLVCLSWIVFWMDRDDMGNRMALGITTILTIMFLLGAINATMPRVSYPKALDWYLIVSFAFVFLSLFECIIVYGVGKNNRRREEQETKKPADRNDKSQPNGTVKRLSYYVNSSGISMMSLNDGKSSENVDKESHAREKESRDFHQTSGANTRKFQLKAVWLDIAARVLFPLGFVVYNIAYWLVYV